MQIKNPTLYKLKFNIEIYHGQKSQSSVQNSLLKTVGKILLGIRDEFFAL